MMRQSFPMAAAILLFCSNGPTPAQQPPVEEIESKDICGIRGADAADIYKSVTTDKAIVFHENLGEYETHIDERNRRLWTFTRQGAKRPASVICRTVVPRGTASTVNMEIRCFGETQECEALRDEWTAFLNDQLSGVRQ